MDLNSTVVSSSEAATVLGIHPFSIQKLIYSGALPAEKIANRWLIPRDALSEFAKTYKPSRGRPRVKRKYTKWSVDVVATALAESLDKSYSSVVGFLFGNKRDGHTPIMDSVTRGQFSAAYLR